MINTLKTLRKSHKMTQTELADKVAVTRQTIISIENGTANPSIDLAYKIAGVFQLPLEQIFLNKKAISVDSRVDTFRFVDLFCGIGGFRFAAERFFKERHNSFKCVFSSDIDEYACQSYKANFGEKPSGDITKVRAQDVPDHDLLFAGFPCQPFSIIGLGKGFEDTRGTLFFEIARILSVKKPKAFILENVKRLVSHENGKTFKKILQTLRELGYYVDYKILNALDCGLPQKRERVIIVGANTPFHMAWPERVKNGKSLKDTL